MKVKAKYWDDIEEQQLRREGFSDEEIQAFKEGGSDSREGEPCVRQKGNSDE